MNAYHVKSIDNPNDELRESVHVELRAHNQTANPHYWEASGKEENDPKPLNLFAFDADDKVIGGLFGCTQFAWLKIEIMATKKIRRGHGIGTELVKRAEEIGIRRGCKYAFVDTMEYQAPAFYEKLGYDIVGQLEDWDSHGHAKFFLTKQLVQKPGFSEKPGFFSSK